MKLIDVLEIVNENAEVRVYNSDGDEIARYDGKNSIPENLNGEEVDEIRPMKDDYWDNIFIAIYLI